MFETASIRSRYIDFIAYSCAVYIVEVSFSAEKYKSFLRTFSIKTFDPQSVLKSRSEYKIVGHSRFLSMDSI